MIKRKTHCKWGHSLDDARIYRNKDSLVRYCRTCKIERARYDYYRVKCKMCNVEDNVATWNKWASDLWGKPVGVK